MKLPIEIEGEIAHLVRNTDKHRIDLSRLLYRVSSAEYLELVRYLDKIRDVTGSKKNSEEYVSNLRILGVLVVMDERVA